MVSIFSRTEWWPEKKNIDQIKMLDNSNIRLFDEVLACVIQSSHAMVVLSDLLRLILHMLLELSFERLFQI
jgi:hypothetical protein